MILRTQEEIMQNWNTDNSDNPLVSVQCITYNHEPYIAQTLDGFLMQKTTFPFEVIVHDDASTDRTADIVREYEKKFPKIIKPIYETENQYSKHDGSLDRIVNAALKGKYIALCEGDDYWIDENKLQIQVDFLERNLEYGMCYTNVRHFVQKTNKFSNVDFIRQVKDFEDLLLNGNRIPTLTTVFRKTLFDNYVGEIYPQDKGWLMGDYPLWLYFAHESKVKFLDRVTGIYRVLENSASHSNNVEKIVAFSKSTWEIRNFFSKKYLNKDLVFFDEHLKKGYLYLTSNNRIRARNEFILCKKKSIRLVIYRIITLSTFSYFLFKQYKKIKKMCFDTKK